MRRSFILCAALLCAAGVRARNLGFGVDSFNRVVPVSATRATAFSPLSFEIDSVLFAEAVDPIRRSVYAAALGVMDEFEAEYRPLARLPFEEYRTNGFEMAWTHAIVVDDPQKVDSAFRLTVQDLYGVEVCRADWRRGIEAWVRARFEGAFDDWRLPDLPKDGTYALQDIVSVSARVSVSNGWKRVCPTHVVYRQPLVGGMDFYALVPKPGRPVSSVRTRMTSVTLPEILAFSTAVIDPPVPVRLALPPLDFVTTNDLAGVYSYFKFPTAALKPYHPGMKPSSLRQTMRFRLKVPPAPADAERLEGPFLFLIHDSVGNTIPAIGIVSG